MGEGFLDSEYRIRLGNFAGSAVEEELCELQSAGMLKMRVVDLSLGKLRISLKAEYLTIYRKVMNTLPLFSTLESQNKESKAFMRTFFISEEAQYGSYLVPELI